MEKRNDFCIPTYTGVTYCPMNPKPDDVNLRDIAHALANQCRFAGHTKEFYSIAEHCVRVSLLVEELCEAEGEYSMKFNAMFGLMHDAAEAYLIDLLRPIKEFTELGKIYCQIEDKNTRAIFQHFGLPPIMPNVVEHADMILLATEKRDLMADCPAVWGVLPDPLQQTILPMNPRDAEEAFFVRYEQLTGCKNCRNY